MSNNLVGKIDDMGTLSIIRIINRWYRKKS